MLVFLAQVFLEVVADSFSQRDILGSIVAFLVGGLDGLVKELLDLFDIFLADTALILVVVMLTIDQSLHGFALLLLHELGDDVILVGAVNKGGPDVNFDSCEHVGIDPSSISISTFKNNMGASPGSESSGGSNPGHSCSDNNELVDLFHLQ